MKYFGHKLKLINQLFKLRMDKNLEQLDITIAQMHVLLYLYHSQSKVTQKQLSESFGVKHSTMAGILNRLKEKELIEIVVDEYNKKFKNIFLTNKAIEIKEILDRHRNETESILIEGFSQKEINALEGYLDRIYYNLINGTEISEKDIKCFNKDINQLERRHEND